MTCKLVFDSLLASSSWRWSSMSTVMALKLSFNIGPREGGRRLALLKINL